MSTVLVTGATGNIGSSVVQYLLRHQHRVRIYTHRARPSVPQNVEIYHGDIQTGSGLAGAIQGVDAVIHCASNSQEADHATDLQGSHHLIQAAEANGSPPTVYVSIVGIDRSEYAYHKAKLAVEQLIEQSTLPWTILRATHLHTLVLGIIKAAEEKAPRP